MPHFGEHVGRRQGRGDAPAGIQHRAEPIDQRQRGRLGGCPRLGRRAAAAGTASVWSDFLGLRQLLFRIRPAAFQADLAAQQQRLGIFVRILVGLGQRQALVEHPAGLAELAAHGEDGAAFTQGPRNVVAADAGGTQRLAGRGLGAANQRLATLRRQQAAAFRLQPAAGGQPGSTGTVYTVLTCALLRHLHGPLDRLGRLVQSRRRPGCRTPSASSTCAMLCASLRSRASSLATISWGMAPPRGPRPDVEDDARGLFVAQFQARPVVPLRLFDRALHVAQVVQRRGDLVARRVDFPVVAGALEQPDGLPARIDALREPGLHVQQNAGVVQRLALSPQVAERLADVQRLLGVVHAALEAGDQPAAEPGNHAHGRRVLRIGMRQFQRGRIPFRQVHLAQMRPQRDVGAAAVPVGQCQPVEQAHGQQFRVARLPLAAMHEQRGETACAAAGPTAPRPASAVTGGRNAG